METQLKAAALFVGTISAAALSWVSMNHAVGYQGFGRSNNRAVINDSAFQLDAIRVQLHNGFRLICEAQPNGQNQLHVRTLCISDGVGGSHRVRFTVDTQTQYERVPD